MKKNIIYLSFLLSNIFSEKDASIIDSVLNICGESDKKTSQKTTPSRINLEKKSSSGTNKPTSEKVSHPIHLESCISKTPHKNSLQETQKITPVDTKNTEMTTLTFIDTAINTKETDNKKKITNPKLTHSKKKAPSYSTNHNVQKNRFNQYNINRKFVRKGNKSKKQTMMTLKKLKGSCAKRNNQGPARVSHRVYSY